MYYSLPQSTFIASLLIDHIVCAISLNLQNHHSFIKGLSIRIEGKAPAKTLKAISSLQLLPESIKGASNFSLSISQELTTHSGKHIGGIISKNNIGVRNLNTI